MVDCGIDIEGYKGDIDQKGREAQDLRKQRKPHFLVRVRVVVKEGVVESENALIKVKGVEVPLQRTLEAGR